MAPEELLRWMAFYRLFPFDDFHRHHRPAALIAQSMGGGDMQDKLDWLQPDPRNDGVDDADLKTMRAMGFAAKGGA